MVFMLKHAKSASGVEKPGQRCNGARRRGLDVEPGDFLQMQRLPPADLYYFWNSLEVNMLLLRRILGDMSFHGTIVVAMGDNTLSSQPSFSDFVDGYADYRPVPYNEGTGRRESGVFIVVVLQADEARVVLKKRGAVAPDFVLQDPRT